MLHFAWVLGGIPRNSATQRNSKDTTNAREKGQQHVMLFHHHGGGGGCTAVSACFPLAAFQLVASCAGACLASGRDPGTGVTCHVAAHDRTTKPSWGSDAQAELRRIPAFLSMMEVSLKKIITKKTRPRPGVCRRPQAQGAPKTTARPRGRGGRRAGIRRFGVVCLRKEKKTQKFALTREKQKTPQKHKRHFPAARYAVD